MVSMDLAWMGCGALLWGIVVLLVWGFQKLEHTDGEKS